MDGKYIKSVHRTFSDTPLKTVPNFTLRDLIYYTIIKGIKVIPILNYVEYKHEQIQTILENEVGWQYYGGHHHESYYTHFFQSFYLPQKFNIDKRLLEYSALIRSGYITRECALQEIDTSYSFDEELVEYAVKKLGLTSEDLNQVIAIPRKFFYDYPTYYPLMNVFRPIIKMACDLGIFPNLLYQKYLG
jgi:hypothetical protein